MEFVGKTSSHPSRKRPPARRKRNDITPDRFLFLIDQELSPTSFGFRVVIFLAFLFMGFGFLTEPLSPELMGSFWHNVNLPFHEAGHVLFGFLPPVGVSFMGTGMQLLMPLVCGFTLLFKTEDLFGAAICLWWFGQNFLDIAPYINDARSGTLPLLGGNFGESSPYGFHDWEFILGETGLLRHDHAIANASFLFGKIIIVLALLWAGIILFRAFTNRNWKNSI